MNAVTSPRPLAYSIRDAVQVSSIGRTTLYGLISSGEIETVKIGKRRLVKAESLARFIGVAA
ncbi:MAG: helix-turn-helix domain-containing protein [Novosphingobium sp.]